MLIIKLPTSASHVKKEFSRIFPFLKIEFFRTKHTIHGENAKKDILTGDFELQASARYKTTAEIEVHPDMTVASLENQFQEKFELSAQIFRKSGNAWLETTRTDDWTLLRQNSEGEELSGLKRND